MLLWSLDYLRTSHGPVVGPESAVGAPLQNNFVASEHLRGRVGRIFHDVSPVEHPSENFPWVFDA